jgi:hypothetical protein
MWRTDKGTPGAGVARAASLGVLALFTLGLLAATLVQRRFFNSLAVGLALTSALAGVEALRALGGGAGAPPLRRRAAGVALVLLGLLLLAPTLAAQRLPLANLRAWLRGGALRLDVLTQKQQTAARAARWLRDHTPETSGWLDPAARPEYGVLADWTLGHAITTEGRRPTVVDNFGDDLGPRNFELARRYFDAADEREGSAILDALGARYVVVGPGTGMLRRALRGDGRHLARHRLLAEIPADDPGQALRIYEHVAGARLTGRVAPGERVRARLVLGAPRGRRIVYERSATAGAGGRFELRVAHATEAVPGGLRVAGPYELRAGDRLARVRIDVEAVREGLRVPVPDLGGAADAVDAAGGSGEAAGRYPPRERP